MICWMIRMLNGHIYETEDAPDKWTLHSCRTEGGSLIDYMYVIFDIIRERTVYLNADMIISIEEVDEQLQFGIVDKSTRETV